MYSPHDTAEAVGCPIRKSSDQAPARGSPRLIAACYVLHRLSMPRHPPNALTCLIPHTQCESRKNDYSELLNSQTAGRLLMPSGRQILTFESQPTNNSQPSFEFMKIQSTVRSSNTKEAFLPGGIRATLKGVRFAFLFTMYRASPALSTGGR